jgi:primosomal protein N'
VRPVEEVVDREPVLGPELLDLARFVADYYFAPLGEVLRGMLPAALPAWGERKVWLTDAGALAPPRDAVEAAVVEALRGGERLHVGELARGLGDVAGSRGAARRRRPPARRRPAGARRGEAGEVELAPGERRTSRRPGARRRGLVALLAELGRPATVEVVEREAAHRR